jgi:hypothetical protein
MAEQLATTNVLRIGGSKIPADGKNFCDQDHPITSSPDRPMVCHSVLHDFGGCRS